ncbi:MAG: hypothetical protein ACO3T7_05050, partial [Pseudomonadales bacterium]
MPRSRLPVPFWFKKVQWQRGNLEPACAQLGQDAQSSGGHDARADERNGGRQLGLSRCLIN